MLIWSGQFGYKSFMQLLLPAEEAAAWEELTIGRSTAIVAEEPPADKPKLLDDALHRRSSELEVRS